MSLATMDDDNEYKLKDAVAYQYSDMCVPSNYEMDHTLLEDGEDVNDGGASADLNEDNDGYQSYSRSSSASAPREGENSSDSPLDGDDGGGDAYHQPDLSCAAYAVTARQQAAAEAKLRNNVVINLYCYCYYCH